MRTNEYKAIQHNSYAICCTKFDKSLHLSWTVTAHDRMD